MKETKTLTSKTLQNTMAKGGCGECQCLEGTEVVAWEFQQYCGETASLCRNQVIIELHVGVRHILDPGIKGVGENILRF